MQGTEEAEGLRPATSAVAGAATALLVALTGAEVSVRRAIEARRAAVLLPGAVAVGHPAAVEELSAAAVDHGRAWRWWPSLSRKEERIRSVISTH